MSDCWLWSGRRHPVNGYGQAGRNKWAHRIVYEALVGKIPTNGEIDHLCRNRACVNPDHLEAVSRKENCVRAGPFRPHSYRKSKTLSCGHVPDKLYKRGNRAPARICSPCRNAKLRKVK